MSQRVWILFMMMLIALAGLPAGAQAASEITVAAGVIDDSLYTGTPFTYRILIDGHDEPVDVDLDPLAPWQPRLVQEMPRTERSITIVNNRRTERVNKRYMLDYQLTIAKPGAYTLPPVTVKIDGRAYQTNAVQVSVTEPSQTEHLALEVWFDESQVYVGQPVMMHIRWYLGVNVDEFWFDLPAVDDARFDVETGPFDVVPDGEPMTLTLPFGEVTAFREMDDYNDKRMTVLAFDLRVTPQAAGTFDFGQPSVSCNVKVRQRRSGRRSLLDSPFDYDTKVYRFQARAETVKLKVRPLPEEGRPEFFNGLVGRYRINSRAEPTTVDVGEPIELTVIVEGPRAQVVELPTLTELAGFAERFKVGNEPTGDREHSNRKVFRRIVRATSDDVAAIPPVPLSFFDVDKGSYVTIRTAEIPLDVAPTHEVTAADAIGREAVQLGRDVTAVQEGIAANYVGPDLLQNTAFSPATALAGPAVLAVAGAPTAFFALALIVCVRGRENPQRAKGKRRSQAASRALKRLQQLRQQNTDPGQQWAELGDILRGYCADRYDRLGESLTAEDCRQLLADEHRPERVDLFYRLMQQCDQSRYAGGGASRQAVDIEPAMDLMQALDKEGK